MTPAVQLLKRQKVAYELHTFNVDDSDESYGLAAAKALGVPPERVFKTLLVCFNGDPKALGVCILPVTHTLNLKRAAKAHGQKSAQMADPAIAEKTTGYVVGGISPLGQKKALPTVVDHHAETLSAVYVSGGKRGLDLSLAPADLLQLTRGRFASLCVADAT
ncbi:Cys-tRNA(Pro) deacylase [Saccharospirillum impatiens]|uniref:Cys-tRNA(Pro) deacylase n=1 Tax=Saccharospirillum impatiens TaxID=169438 RepID=UPI0004023554|nr:Cys-tRNA(Pro) deacylase [Saccharospirillum impatiens]